jgi:hypothetical protein
VKRTIAFGVLTALATASVAFGAASGWRVVKQGAQSGDFAVTSISATIGHPSGIAVRLIGQVTGGNAIWACTKGFGVSSWMRRYNHAGFYVVPFVRGNDSCDVTASVAGYGRVVVQILRS